MGYYPDFKFRDDNTKKSLLINIIVQRQACDFKH